MIYAIFIIPLLMIIIGYLLFKYPPKKINFFVGYRTHRSMKNIKNWKVANQYCGKIWLKIGTIMLIVSLLIVAYFLLINTDIKETYMLIIALCELITLLLSAFMVENKIKEK